MTFTADRGQAVRVRRETRARSPSVQAAESSSSAAMGTAVESEPGAESGSKAADYSSTCALDRWCLYHTHYGGR